MGVTKASPVTVEEYNKMIPTDIQSRYSKTIQTHNAVFVPASGSSYSPYLQCDGFNELAVTFINDAEISSSVTVFWSNDGINDHGQEILDGTTGQSKAISTPIKTRFFRLRLFNNDTAAHTMSSWAYLKV